MFNPIVSQIGEPILTWNGKFLSSKYNSSREAKDWLATQRAQVMSCSDIILLGVGSGYHVIELLNEFPQKKIVVIDSNKEVISFFRKTFPIESAKVHVLCIKDEESLANDKVLRATIKRFYTLLYHNVSLELFRELIAIRDWLLGRNRQSFEWISEIRGEKAWLDTDAVYDAAHINQNLDIKQLKIRNETFSLEDKNMNKVKLNLLRELIA